MLRNLRELTLEYGRHGASPTQLLDMLCGCADIEKLSLVIDVDRDCIFKLPTTPRLALPHLHTLKLNVDPPVVTNFLLAIIHTTALTDFDLHFHDHPTPLLLESVRGSLGARI